MHSLLLPKKANVVEGELVRLMDTYGNDVLRISYMYLKDQQKAEDAFQEVFIRVFKKFEKFKGESSERTWIMRITINVCKDMLRSSWIRKVILTDWHDYRHDEGEVETRVEDMDQGRTLFEAVLSLPPAFKDVIILYYYQGYSTSEISKILKVAEGTVRSRLYRARELLKKKLEGSVALDE